jgi:hypothetical protein
VRAWARLRTRRGPCRRMAAARWWVSTQ